MRNVPFHPQRIFVERSAEDLPLAQELLDLWPDIPVTRVDHPREAIATVSDQADPIAAGKRSLLIARQRGPFIKRCPGTKRYICCGYRIINAVTGCPLDCSYCILQSYLTNPLLTIYANTKDLLAQLGELLSSGEDDFYRLGTGELADSLSLDPFLHQARWLVPYFADKANAILELKTKTAQVEELLGLDHGGRTVVSWSLNAPTIVQREEHGAPPIEERLEAARRCYRAGYRIGFHFDPLIDHPGWQENYRRVVDDIFAHVGPEAIAWISLGALRYPLQLDGIIRRRHPDSDIVLGEMLPGADDKLRYFRPVRVKLFRRLNAWIKEHDPDVFVYLCMESDLVWRQSLGWSPGGMATLSQMLDERARP